MRQCPILFVLILASIAAGCQSRPTNGDPPSDSEPHANRNTADSRPAAYIDGAVVTRDELYAILIEAQGGQALSELLLDRAITRRLAEQEITLTQADLDAEHQQLLASLSADADQATRLLKTMRAQRGLGNRRFEALLKRNAGLRRLVRDGVTVGEAAIQQAYAVRYGKRYRVRLITADAVDTLSGARRKVLEGASFTDLAVTISTDPSASQGGLLSPISPADATYPKAVRDALGKLSTTERSARLSPIIAMPEGYALLWLEEVIEEQGPTLEATRDQLAQAVRLELQRVRMQQLARVMVGQANVVVLDPALDAGWQRQRKTIVGPSQ